MAEERKPVVTPGLGQHKFGVQVNKNPTIYLYRNGDKHHTGERWTVKLVKTWDQFLEKSTTLVKPVTGAVRKLYKTDLKTQVKSLDELEDGASYLCVGGEKPTSKDQLAAVFNQ